MSFHLGDTLLVIGNLAKGEKMRHRDQLMPLSPSKDDLSRASKEAMALCIVAHMIVDGQASCEPLFLDKSIIKTGITDALAFGTKLKSDTEPVTLQRLGYSEDIRTIEEHPSISLDEAMGILTILGKTETVGAVIRFKTSGNVLAIVRGYMIDLANGIFIHTGAVEYDIQTYRDDFGDFEDVSVIFLSHPLSPAEPVPVLPKQPQKKKQKTAPAPVEVK
jgi:hypothetical protein